MSAVISLTARLLEPPDVSILVHELERIGWSLVSSTGQIVFSISVDDLTDEQLADGSRKDAVIKQISEHVRLRKQAMFSVASAEGSVAINLLPQDDAFVVTAIYGCEIPERASRPDLSALEAMVFPAIQKAARWISSYSISIDR